MVKTYVLIVTDPGRTRHVTADLAAIPQVEAVNEVMGPYDIVVEIVTESLTDIRPILSDQIRVLEGIESTTSLVTLPHGAPPANLT
ncbi:MAG: Lrp/AsnC ligand binding domain-containing protein [Chloroflexi bacterium]|nr:Lrp/AsnC ligand binding domain-containing protein [Chloroflexota bacterium]